MIYKPPSHVITLARQKYFLRLIFTIACAIISFTAIMPGALAATTENTVPQQLAQANFTPTMDYLQDKAALDKLQYDSFLYIWEGGDPASGMAYEGSDHMWEGIRPTAVGGTGFGVAAIVVAVDRGWISREEALVRLQKIVTFLRDKTSRKDLHGAFPHWINGNTGETIPFGNADRGADLVETSLLMQGLLIARAYFNGPGVEAELGKSITEIWKDIDWNWFTAGEENGLHWHWSKEHNFPGLKILGYNECMITYVLAISSPTYPISRKSYDYWTSGKGYQPKELYGYRVPASLPGAGPLFLTHYSFIGLNPHHMADSFVPNGYFLRNILHTLSNRGYSLQNAPAKNLYNERYWGLTASQIKGGYAASEPSNDNATVAPTAALSSMPYTPHYSMQVLQYLLPRSTETSQKAEAVATQNEEQNKTLKTKSTKAVPIDPKSPEATAEAVLQQAVWGKFGPADALSLRNKWVSSSWLAIDQLPIVAMVENYRSGLLWDLLMADEDIKRGLKLAGITEPVLSQGFPEAVVTLNKQKNKYIPDAYDVRKHPDSGLYLIPYWCDLPGKVRFTFTNKSGEVIYFLEEEAHAGRNILAFPQFMQAAITTNDPPLTLSLQITEDVTHTLPVRLH